MGQVIQFNRSERRGARRQRTGVPAHLNGHLVELGNLSLGGVCGGTIEVVSHSEIALEIGDQAELRLPRPAVIREDIGFSEPISFCPPVTVVIVRKSGSNKTFGACFLDLNDAEADLVRELMQRGNS